MKIIELNRPAISPKLSIADVSIKPYVSHMQYMGKSRVVQVASLEKPVYRLCKDYEIDGIQFAINLLTEDKDMGKAEKFMDKVAKEVTREQAVEYTNGTRPFTYLNKEYKGSK